MKKLSLLLLIIISNYALVSCTEENLADVTNSPLNDQYGTHGEKEHIDPVEEPPGNEN